MKDIRSIVYRKPGDGFTLVELIMVVAVLSIVVTLALPGLATAKRRANETSAITALRMISSAQSQHRVRNGTFTDVTTLESIGFLDQNFSDNEKSGYMFENAQDPSSSAWALQANPVNVGVTGDRYYYVDTSGVIRYNDSAQAGPADPAIQ